MSNNFTNATFKINTNNVSLVGTDNVTKSMTREINTDIMFIEYITVPLFCIVGIIGNALTLVIMSSKYFRSSTTSVYLSALAISDSIFIILSPFTKHFINELIAIDIRALSQSGCKAFFCFFRSAKICSSWFIVVICIERYIVICFPLRARLISTKSSATIAVFTVIVSVFTLCGFWTMIDDIVNGVCTPNLSTPDTKQLSAAFVIAGTLIFSTIPTTIILIFTPLTIFKLFRQQALRRNMTVTGGNHDHIMNHITKTLICVMIAYVVLVTPIATAHAVAFFSGDNIFRSKNPAFVFFRAIAQMCESLNYSINFFLYVMSSKTFRKRLFEMLGRANVRHDQIASPRPVISSRTSKSPVAISTIQN